MTAKELAEQLDGGEYGSEITIEQGRAAKAAGLVVVFGASDNLMLFRGAIYDEVDYYDGEESYLVAYLDATGLLVNRCEHDCPYFRRLQESAVPLRANWDQDGFSWTYTLGVPHEKFRIHEDGEPYCEGIVFKLSDVKGDTP
jgi:hypothetical protein